MSLDWTTLSDAELATLSIAGRQAAYAEIMRQFFIMPVRPEIAPPTGALPFEKVKLIGSTPAQIEDGVPEIKESWRDTFGV